MSASQSARMPPSSQGNLGALRDTSCARCQARELWCLPAPRDPQGRNLCRDPPTRMAPTFWRFGSFEIFSVGGNGVEGPFVGVATFSDWLVLFAPFCGMDTYSGPMSRAHRRGGSMPPHARVLHQGALLAPAQLRVDAD
jgi:hypothetical protein